MFKIIFTLFILAGLIYSSEIKQHYAQKVDPNQKIKISKNSNAKISHSQLSQKMNKYELGRTWYDYTNNSGRTIAHALDSNDGQDGIHFVFMKRQPDIIGNRYVTYDYWDLNLKLFFGNQSITEIQPTGYGTIVNGFNDEVFSVMHGGGLHLYQDTGESNYSFVNIFSRSSGLYPSIERVGNLIVMSAGDSLYHSTDNGLNWNSTQLPNLADYYSLNPQINPANTNEISFIESDAPYLKKWTTTNLGNSWTSEIIYDQSNTNPDGTVYLITNFEQFNYMYSQDSTFHVVSNGYGLNADSSDYIFPIIYWNSRDRQWIELTDPSKGRPSDTTITQILANNRPGNGIGNAFPHISEGPNGELVVIWQQWEDDGTGMPVIVTPSGGTSVFCTDIVGAISLDSGQLWSDPFYLAGTSSESEVYPNIAKEFMYNQAGDSAYFDIMYLWDTNAGTSLFAGGNDPSECIWYYEHPAIYRLDPDAIYYGTKILDKFNLYQNYPNPFNPTTTIKYELANPSQIKIEIIDILGQSVKTLINQKQNRGVHTVTWDGLNNLGKPVSGGIYFYQLNTENYSQTKKMLLLK